MTTSSPPQRAKRVIQLKKHGQRCHTMKATPRKKVVAFRSNSILEDSMSDDLMMTGYDQSFGPFPSFLEVRDFSVERIPSTLVGYSSFSLPPSQKYYSKSMRHGFGCCKYHLMHSMLILCFCSEDPLSLFALSRTR